MCRGVCGYVYLCEYEFGMLLLSHCPWEKNKVCSDHASVCHVRFDCPVTPSACLLASRRMENSHCKTNTKQSCKLACVSHP